MIKLDTSITKWFDKINNRDGISNVILLVTPVGFKIQQYDTMKYQYADIFLSHKDDSVVQFEIPEKKEYVMPLQDIRTIVGILGSFNDNIEMIPGKTNVVFKTKSKEVTCQYIDPKMIQHADEPAPTIKYKYSCTVGTEFMKNVQNDISVFGAAIGRTMILAHRGKILEAVIESSNQKTTERIETEEEFDAKIKLGGKLLSQIARTLSEDVINIGFTENGFAIRIEERSDTFYSNTVLSAVDEEEE